MYNYVKAYMKEIMNNLMRGTNADMPNNIRTEIKRAGGKINYLRVKPQEIEVDWELKDFKANNRVYLDPNLFITHLVQLSEDIAHAVWKQQKSGE